MKLAAASDEMTYVFGGCATMADCATEPNFYFLGGGGSAMAPLLETIVLVAWNCL
jgi:hypothetical protein